MLGRGGMGQVFRARDTRLDREVAIKILYPNLAVETEYVRRFFREGQAVARLDHPNVIRVFDVGQEKNLCFIAMEFVEGRTLLAILDERGALPVAETLSCAAQIVGGLQCTHTQRVLHRDIKPGNIMIAQDSSAKILDFGLARIYGVRALTLTGSVVGTIEYISPEQVMNDPVDARSDLYSFGVVLYEMLAGQRPFIGEEPIAVIYQHINDEPLPPSVHGRHIPVEVDRLVLALLAKRASDRYADAGAFLADLAVCEKLIAARIASDPTTASPEPTVIVVPHRPRDEFYCILAGRDAELTRMLASIDRTLEEDGQLVLLGGNEGTGKSRLIDETLHYAETHGMWTLFGRCMYQEMVMPYQPFVDALSYRLSAASPVENARFRVRLLKDFPDIAGLMRHVWTSQERRTLGEYQPPALAPAAEQQRLFQSIMHLFFDIADGPGVVLCMDDLHWGDTGSVQLLHYMARQLKGHRICLIAAYRPEEVQDASERPFSGTLQRLNAENIGETVTLHNLDETAIRTMVQDIVGSRVVSVSLSNQVYRESGGNLLYAIEILKWWRDRSKTHKLDIATLEQLDEIAVAVPPRITDLILNRLNRLQDTERELLEVAAVGGDWFDVDRLSNTAGVGRLETLRQLHRLERRHAVIAAVERGTYQFTHGKIQEVLYHELPEIQLQAYHAAWGRTLIACQETGEDVTVELLASHLYAGGDGQAALAYLIKAGEDAIKVCVFREAKRYWEQAAEAVEDMEGENARKYRLDILLNLGRIYYDLGDWDLSTERNKQAFGLAQEMKETGKQAKALLQIGAVLIGRNQWNAAIQIFEQSIKMYTKVNNDVGVAHANSYLGNICYWRGQWERAHFYYLNAHEIYLLSDKTRVAVTAINLGLVSVALGENETAISYYNMGRELHRKNNNLPRIAQTGTNLGMVFEREENCDNAIKNHRESVALLERMGHSLSLWNAYINYSRVLARTGDISLAQEILQKAYAILKELKNQRGLAEAKRVDGLIVGIQQNWN
ncbi:MAG: protein kinase [candidate division Zixibacteria bacterium]|nr:protein kinase [candidate division Zixibacteria bacterium]